MVYSEVSFDPSLLEVWVLVGKGVKNSDLWLAHFLSKSWKVI